MCGVQIGEPMDFSLKNYISLMDLQNLLVRLVRPDVEVRHIKRLLNSGTDTGSSWKLLLQDFLLFRNCVSF